MFTNSVNVFYEILTSAENDGFTLADVQFNFPDDPNRTEIIVDNLRHLQFVRTILGHQHTPGQKHVRKFEALRPHRQRRTKVRGDYPEAHQNDSKQIQTNSLAP
jgi:hypothetical protein